MVKDLLKSGERHNKIVKKVEYNSGVLFSGLCLTPNEKTTKTENNEEFSKKLKPVSKTLKF